MTRYRIEPYNTCVDWWIILDEQDDIVFGGTYIQCEDWLDREENRLTPPQISDKTADHYDRCDEPPIQDQDGWIWSEVPPDAKIEVHSDRVRIPQSLLDELTNALVIQEYPDGWRAYKVVGGSITLIAHKLPSKRMATEAALLNAPWPMMDGGV